jgi:cell division septal protein FtsQ
MRPKRKRTYIKPRPVIIALLVLVVAAGIWFSPVTMIRRVRVEGSLPGDQDRFIQMMQSLKGIPCAQVDPRDVESQALANSDVRSAELSRTPFGSALLRVTYRRPVARLFGSPNVLLSEEGVLYPSAQVSDDLPVVQLLHGGPPTLGTLAANWQPTSIAKLAVDARKIFPEGDVRIQEGQGGVVWLNVAAGRVILGSLDDLEAKLNTLRKRRVDFPNELSENEALDLTSPNNPSLQPRSRS